MKTIREIADELGVSKQAVYKRYKGKLHTVCAPYAHTVCGTLYLDEPGEILIKQDFSHSISSSAPHTDAHTECSNSAPMEYSDNDEILKVLQSTINTLQEQLHVKDKQIEQLSAALVAAQQTAQAAQALHAGTIQTQLSPPSAEPAPPQKTSFFSRFHRGKRG